MTKRRTIFMVAPPNCDRERDERDMHELLAALKWRAGVAQYQGPEEAGPLSGERWAAILGRHLADDYRDPLTKSRDVTELDQLVKILRTAGTKPSADRDLYADSLARWLEQAYGKRGRPSNRARDQLIAWHYYLFRERWPTLNEKEAITEVTEIWRDLGHARLTAQRVRRIVVGAGTREEAQRWIAACCASDPDRSRTDVIDDHLAVFDPRTSDKRIFEMLKGTKKS